MGVGEFHQLIINSINGFKETGLNMNYEYQGKERLKII